MMNENERANLLSLESPSQRFTQFAVVHTGSVANASTLRHWYTSFGSAAWRSRRATSVEQAAAPKIRLVKELGREGMIDPEAEAKLLAVGRQPMKDVLIIIQDTGMRPEEVFRIRIENIDWSRRLIFNPHGKTRASRRHLPISLRMCDLLCFVLGKDERADYFPPRDPQPDI